MPCLPDVCGVFRHIWEFPKIGGTMGDPNIVPLKIGSYYKDPK